jgi:hypothetical protein
VAERDPAPAKFISSGPWELSLKGLITLGFHVSALTTHVRLPRGITAAATRNAHFVQPCFCLFFFSFHVVWGKFKYKTAEKRVLSENSARAAHSAQSLRYISVARQMRGINPRPETKNNDVIFIGGKTRCIHGYGPQEEGEHSSDSWGDPGVKGWLLTPSYRKYMVFNRLMSTADLGKLFEVMFWVLVKISSFNFTNLWNCSMCQINRSRTAVNYSRSNQRLFATYVSVFAIQHALFKYNQTWTHDGAKLDHGACVQHFIQIRWFVL